MDLSTITVADFKAYFFRDFPYLPPTLSNAPLEQKLNYILDADIEKAFGEAKIGLNQGLFGNNDSIRIGYLYLSAHYLCNDLKAAKGGIFSTATFPMTGRTVGSVSEQYGIPEPYLRNPSLAFFTTSAYGLKYLALILPNMVGNVGAVMGWTNP